MWFGGRCSIQVFSRSFKKLNFNKFNFNLIIRSEWSRWNRKVNFCVFFLNFFYKRIFCFLVLKIASDFGSLDAQVELSQTLLLSGLKKPFLFVLTVCHWDFGYNLHINFFYFLRKIVPSLFTVGRNHQKGLLQNCSIHKI